MSQSGYGIEQTSAAYGTPLLVGLFGLLLSSGKGLFWFAPPLLALPHAAAGAWRERRAEVLMFAGAVVPSLLLNARFRAWGGDGSWGPRYLVPFIPLLMIPVAWAVGRSGGARRWAVALFIAGVLAQAGGVAVNYGSYLRESGAYPYQTAFEDPRFLEDVHWVPNFSPLAGHWRMLARNAGEHFRGEWPSIRLSAGPEGASGAAPRIALSADDQARLLRGLDFWFLYFVYAGAAGRSILVVPVLMLLGSGLLLLREWRSGSGTRVRA
jgi:hypothetical protein